MIGAERIDPRNEIRALVCPNAFKGSLTAAQAADAIAEGMARASEGGRRCLPVLLPLADGGDGTLETLVQATRGSTHRAVVRDPLGRPIEAVWGRMGAAEPDTAVVEMASASGLRLLAPQERDPLRASTFGAGELIREAVEAECKRIVVGIGGSATNDGGAGMAQALGARFLDAEGRELEPGGAALARLARIDRSGWRLPEGVEVLVACDVDNPLVGPQGASAVYGPQKGAGPDDVRLLDSALGHYARIVERDLGISIAAAPGAGAAGGLGGGLLAFCRAGLQPGVDLVLDLTGFDGRIEGCALAVTGEGRLDAQTSCGKLVQGVAKRAKRAGVPTVALAGSIAEGAEARLREDGLVAALPIVDGPRRLEECMEDAYAFVMVTSERLTRLLWLCLTAPVGG
jgi:glycerate kinase